MIPDGAFTAMFAAVALVGAATAAALIFGLPWAWAAIKPLMRTLSV